LTGGQKVESSNLSIPTIFFAKIREFEFKSSSGILFSDCSILLPKASL